METASHQEDTSEVLSVGRLLDGLLPPRCYLEGCEQGANGATIHSLMRTHQFNVSNIYNIHTKLYPTENLQE